MRFKVYDKYNKIMYMDADKIQDSKWNLGKMHNNKHFETCISVDYPANCATTLFTNDLIRIKSVFYYIKLEEGCVKIVGVHEPIEELLIDHDPSEIELYGSILEVE